MFKVMKARVPAGVRALVSSLLVSSLASAQSGAEDSGWFDPPASPAGPAAEADQTRASAAQPLKPRPAPAPDDADPRALTAFKPKLDPYGHWETDARYGTVWVPHQTVVGPNFSPYVSGGRWALSANNEWVWVSDYPFGPVVYHYGRWVWTPSYGWAWIPGYRYSPSWVTFRVPYGNYAYVGWAPLGPDFIWVNGRAVSVYWYSSYYWVFCPSDYVFRGHVHRYVVRDRSLVDRLSYSTRRYVPAQPQRSPASPSARDARIPATALPKERVAVQPVVRPSAESRRSAAASPTSREVVVPERSVSPAPVTVPERSASPAPVVVPERRRSTVPEVERRRTPAPAPAKLRLPGDSGRRAPLPSDMKRKKVRP